MTILVIFMLIDLPKEKLSVVNLFIFVFNDISIYVYIFVFG